MAFLAHLNKRTWLYALIIVAFGSIVYRDICSLPFLPLWDDAGHVLNINEIRSLNGSNITKIFSSFYVGMYQPLTSLTYAIDYQIWGLSPLGFHLTSLLLHLLTGLMVFLVLNKITKRRLVGLIIALFFVVHPANVEAVAWVSARNTILSALFFLFSVFFYIDYLQNDYKIKYLIATFILFVLSVLSKATAVTLPAILFLFDYLYSRKTNFRLFAEKIPFIIVSIVIGLVAVNARAADSQISEAANQFSGMEMFFVVLSSVVTYLSKILLPVDYSAYYTYPILQMGNLTAMNVILPIIVFLFLIIIIFLQHRTERKIMVVGLLFFILTISVTLKFVLVGLQLMADRYLYLPMVGVFLFLIPLIKSMESHRILKFAGYGIAALLLGYYIFRTITYLGYWKDEDTLFARTIEVSPDAIPVKNLIGIRQKNKGELRAAMKTFDEIIAQYPEYGSTYNNRGNLWRSVKHLDFALKDYEKALKYENRAVDSSSILTNIGIVYAMKNNLDEALKFFNQALQLDPENQQAYFNRGNAKALSGNFKDACNDFDKAIEISHDFGQAFYARGLAEVQLNMTEKATADFTMSKNLGYSPEEPDTSLPGKCYKNHEK